MGRPRRTAEPLVLEYIAAVHEGHDVQILDLRLT